MSDIVLVGGEIRFFVGFSSEPLGCFFVFRSNRGRDVRTCQKFKKSSKIIINKTQCRILAQHQTSKDKAE